MLATLMMLLLTQVPCTPGEGSVVCNCKQGMASACETLVGDEPAKAAEVLEALLQAVQMAKDGEDKERLRTAADALSRAQAASGTNESADCKGQEHHPISRRIATRLERHPTLKGLFKPRDRRFVTRAKDKRDHCGYQRWHRDVDDEVIRWLERSPEATPEEFLAKLRSIYNRPDMRARFPNGF